MAATISNPASSDFRIVIRYLSARDRNASEQLRELCEMYGPTAIREGKLGNGVASLGKAAQMLANE